MWGQGCCVCLRAERGSAQRTRRRGALPWRESARTKRDAFGPIIAGEITVTQMPSVGTVHGAGMHKKCEASRRLLLQRALNTHSLRDRPTWLSPLARWLHPPCICGRGIGKATYDEGGRLGSEGTSERTKSKEQQRACTQVLLLKEFPLSFAQLNHIDTTLSGVATAGHCFFVPFIHPSSR